MWPVELVSLLEEGDLRLCCLGQSLALLCRVLQPPQLLAHHLQNQFHSPQCCGSGMFIPEPGSWFLPIPDPGSKNSNKREGRKKISCNTFLCSHKFHKIENYFSFEVLKKQIWANFQRIIELFTQKIVTKPSKIWVWDPGSRGQKGTGSRIEIRNTDPPVIVTW